MDHNLESNPKGNPEGKQATLSTKLLFGSGSIAFGVKNAAFSYFLLIYYNQVLGLSPFLTGLALAIAMAVDALSDIGVGYWTDHFESTWGRRHPFMYAAIIPVAFTFYFLWNPPQYFTETEPLLFGYLVVVAILVRVAITFFEVPNAAQDPELSTDYDDRTRLQSYRHMFGWLGGLVLAALGFFVLFGLDPKDQLGPLGYQWLGLVGAAMMLVASVLSALGTHRHIDSYAKPKVQQQRSVIAVIRYALSLFHSRSFVAVFVSSLLFGAASGLTESLSVYINTFFWGLTSAEIAYIPLLGLVAVTTSFFLAPILAERWGKRRAAIRVYLFAILFLPIAYVAEIGGVFPAQGDTLYLPLIMLHFLIETTAIITMQIIFGSMMADLVEDRSVQYQGQRDEGLIFAARNFSKKVVSGSGILLAGVVLWAAAFPENSELGRIDREAAYGLIGYYLPSVIVLYLGSCLAIKYYKIDRQSHLRNLAHLESA